MDVLDFIFLKAKAGNTIPKELVERGYVNKDRIEQLIDVFSSNDVQSLMRLLIVQSDRQGRTDRPEDAYARAFSDILILLKECNRQFKHKKK